MFLVELAVKGLVYGCMYAMMAVGLTLVYGLLRILHIAHAGVFASGAYMAVVAANATGSLALGLLLAPGGQRGRGRRDLSTGLPAAALPIRRSCR